MAVSEFTDEVRVKVYRSHIGIPVGALVPVAMVASLYCVLYFYANSNWFADELPEQLDGTFPGSFGVQELVVEPSLSATTLYGAEIRRDADAPPIIRAPQVYAEIQPAFLLLGRLVFSEGWVEGGDVRLVFDDQGNLNLLEALGIESSDQPAARAEERPLEIAFPSLACRGCSLELVRPEFDIRIPEVDIDRAAITLGARDLQMRTPGLEIPVVDFRFRPELFNFPREYGSWNYRVEDFAVEEWRWSGDGFRTEHFEFYAEGVRAEGEGRMSFPDEVPREPEMTYRGRAELSVPYWSPLVQYFVRDTVHFEVPEIQAAAEGSLEIVDGRARVEADVLDAAGLRFTDLTGRARLRNQFIELERAEADLYGGTVRADWGWFDMFEVAYGGAGSFDAINPAAVVREFGTSLPAAEGTLSGGFEVYGAVPMGAEIDPLEPFAPAMDAKRQLAEVEVTERWRFRPSGRSALPVEEVSVRRGGRLRVDYERVEVPTARIVAGGGETRVRHFELDYDAMEFTAPGRGRAVDIRWRIPEVRPWVRGLGVRGISGRAEGSLWADGPVAAPDGGVEARLTGGRIETDREVVGDVRGRLDVGVREGVLDVRELFVGSDVGNVTGEGTLEFARIGAGPEGRGWGWRASQPVEAQWTVEEFDLSVVDSLVRAGIGAEGELDASGEVRGTVQRPKGTFAAAIGRGQTRWIRFRDFALQGGFEGDQVRVDALESRVGPSGRVEANGRYAPSSGDYQFQASVEGLSVGETKYVRGIAEDLRPSGRLNVELHGEGAVDEPVVAGDVELQTLRLGDRSLGDVALVVNTVGETLYVSGAALPIGTLVLEIPLGASELYYARFGVEHLDLARVFPEIGDARWIERLEGTGAIEVTAEPGFSRYVASVDMSSVRLQTPDRTIRTKGPVRASLDSNNRLQIERARVGSDGHFVDLSGAVLLDSYLTSLQLEGELDLGLVDLLGNHVFPDSLPPSLVRSEGVVDVSMEVGGPPSRPIPKGTLDVRDAVFELRDVATPLRVDSGHVTFDRRAIRVPEDRPLSGEFLGGVYTVSGELDVEEYRPERGTFQVRTRNLAYRVPETANATFDTDLQVRAEDLSRPESWTVSGDVDVLNARYYRDISLFEQQVAGRVIETIARRRDQYEAGILEQYPWLTEVAFDVRIRARDGFVIDNNIDRFGLDLEFRLDLRFQRTLQEPRVSGEIDVIDGTVDFQGEQFQVRVGRLAYTGDPANPRVEITAGADIRNRCVEQNRFDDVGPDFQFAGDFDEGRGEVYHVLLRVEGRLETLDVKFESNPFADQRDILSLMLTGCTVDELTASGATQPGLEIALGPLLGRLEKEIQDVVELSEFTIMPGVERTQVRIADRVTRRLEWRFQLDTGASERSGGQQYQLEYRLSDRWSAEVSERSTGEQQNFLLDAKLKYRVPLD